MNNWPKSDMESMSGFYGRHDLDNDGLPSERWERQFLALVDLPYRMTLAWDKSKVVSRVMIHISCRKSLLTILSRIKSEYGEAELLSMS